MVTGLVKDDVLSLSPDRRQQMSEPVPLKKRIERELALFLLLLLAGLLLLPISVYLVGDAIFDGYAGAGFSGFYAALHQALRDGDAAVWFLVLSPYLVWQTLRLTLFLFRRGRPAPAR